MFIPKFPEISDYIKDDSGLIESGELSHEGYIVPEIIMKYGSSKKYIFRMATFLPTIFFTLRNSFKSYKSVKKNPAAPSITAAPDFFRSFESHALELGCSAVGFTEVPPDFIFRHHHIMYKYAFVLTMKMEKSLIKLTPSKVAGKEIWRTYKDLGRIVNKLAVFIRKSGYNAQPGPAIGGDTNYVLLAQKAGLGHIGSHGILISPETGPCQRIAVVYTDIENIPQTDSDEHKWIEAFCSSCGRCIRKCPGKAIYNPVKILDDKTRKYIDFKKCAVPFAKNTGCSICISECTFTRSSYNKIKEGFNG